MSRFRLFGRAAGVGTEWPAEPGGHTGHEREAPTDPRGFPAVAGGAWERLPAWPAPPGVPPQRLTARTPPAARPDGVSTSGAWPAPVAPGGPVGWPAARDVEPPTAVRTVPPTGSPSAAAHAGAVPGIPAGPAPGGRAVAASRVPGAPIDPAEAGALAGAFAVDYLSWDEDDPARRGRVLRDYLRPPVGDTALLGWSGTGRQRAEFALPGLVHPDGDGRVLVDVRVRVTPYRAVGDRVPEPPPETGAVGAVGAGVPAVAPAPTGRGWRSLPSCWVRLSVPVARDGGRLVVDAGEETLGLDATAPPAPEPAPDHALVDDDPLTGGAP